MMAHCTEVPKFGHWEDEEEKVPYTVIFDRARKNRGTTMTNPNDSEENPSKVSTKDTPNNPKENSSMVATGDPSNDSPQTKTMAHRTKVPKFGHWEDEDNVPYIRYFEKARTKQETNTIHFNESHETPVRVATRDPPIGSRPRSASLHGSSSEAPKLPSTYASTAVPKYGKWPSAAKCMNIFSRVWKEHIKAGSYASSNTIGRTPYRMTAQPSAEPKNCCFPWWCRK